MPFNSVFPNGMLLLETFFSYESYFMMSIALQNKPLDAVQGYDIFIPEVDGSQ